MADKKCEVAVTLITVTLAVFWNLIAKVLSLVLVNVISYSNKSKTCKSKNLCINPAENYMSKLTIEAVEQDVKYVQSCEICYAWRRSGVVIVNFEHISRLVLVFLFQTLSS